MLQQMLTGRGQDMTFAAAQARNQLASKGQELEAISQQIKQDAARRAAERLRLDKDKFDYEQRKVTVGTPYTTAAGVFVNRKSPTGEIEQVKVGDIAPKQYEPDVYVDPVTGQVQYIAPVAGTQVPAGLVPGSKYQTPQQAAQDTQVVKTLGTVNAIKSELDTGRDAEGSKIKDLEGRVGEFNTQAQLMERQTGRPQPRYMWMPEYKGEKWGDDIDAGPVELPYAPGLNRYFTERDLYEILDTDPAWKGKTIHELLYAIGALNEAE